MPVVFDTNIIIDVFRFNKQAKKLLEKVERKELSGIISSLTESEILSGKECKNPMKRKIIENTIKLFTKIDVTNDIASKAGEFRRNYSTPLIDSIIAATAFFTKSKVWTKNIDHFKRIKEIDAEEPY